MNTTAINPTVINPVETTATEKTNVLEILLAIRYFLPLAASLGWVLGFAFGSSPVMESIALSLISIGVLSAITVCPLKMLAFPFKCIPVGFSFCRGFIPVYGVADLCAAIFGTIGGFIVGCIIVVMAPAFFTIKKFTEKD